MSDIPKPKPKPKMCDYCGLPMPEPNHHHYDRLHDHCVDAMDDKDYDEDEPFPEVYRW